MCILPSKQELDLRSLPVEPSAKCSDKILDFRSANPFFLSEVRDKFSWRTGGSPCCLASPCCGSLCTFHAKDGEGCSLPHKPFPMHHWLFFLSQASVWKPKCIQVRFMNKYSKTYKGFWLSDGGIHTIFLCFFETKNTKGTVDALSVEVFKARLDEDFSNLT